MAAASMSTGDKWLKFWTYVGLPVLTVVAFAVALDLPRMRFENIPIAILCVAVAVGLHKRKLWAWQLNWLAIGLVYLAVLVPWPIREFNGSNLDFLARGMKQLIATRWTRDSLGDLVLPFAVRLSLATVVWAWPNWIYWKKRMPLFS